MDYKPKITAPEEIRDDPPPFLGEWRRVYAVVLTYLGALIVVFYLFERAATP